jgi:hypothetical protein
MNTPPMNFMNKTGSISRAIVRVDTASSVISVLRVRCRMSVAHRFDVAASGGSSEALAIASYAQGMWR